MRHSAAQTGIARQRAGPRRVLMNPPDPPPRQRRGGVAGSGSLRPLTILHALERTQPIIGLLDGRIVHWSRGAERLYGWTAREAIGSRARDLLQQKNLSRPQAGAARRDGWGEWRRQLRRAHKDGHELTIAAHCLSRRDLHGRLAVIEFDHPAAPAAPAATSQGRDSRQIAHDFNNLLGIVALTLELARERAADPALRELIDEALDAAWQGVELTRHLAEQARAYAPPAPAVARGKDDERYCRDR
jgi:PAS domain S-box-containing protein